MASTKKISLKKLKLDPENPRIPTCSTEEDAIDLLCGAEQILELAKDIAENGISPCEKLIVLQDREKYIAVEGNRRLVALKLLDNPSLAPKHLFWKFSQYSASRQVQIDSVECVIVSDRKEAKHWIETKHSGQNKGKGVKPWNAIQKARYFPSNENRFAYLLFNFLLENVSQFYEITNVTRFISGQTFF
ncbi:ParB/Srx family N-terminal domain-containing protein, partial [Bartonella raoultii]|uniref:ParB/Srx family N-terminal domain-containing protein n=1 Tax=Bartonella raoultii TaxID=1457020 RepID=UPI001ABB2528